MMELSGTAYEPGKVVIEVIPLSSFSSANTGAEMRTIISKRNSFMGGSIVTNVLNF